MIIKDIDGFFRQSDIIFGDPSSPNYSIYPHQKMVRLLSSELHCRLLPGTYILVFISFYFDYHANSYLKKTA